MQKNWSWQASHGDQGCLLGVLTAPENKESTCMKRKSCRKVDDQWGHVRLASAWHWTLMIGLLRASFWGLAFPSIWPEN